MSSRCMLGRGDDFLLCLQQPWQTTDHLQAQRPSPTKSTSKISVSKYPFLMCMFCSASAAFAKCLGSGRDVRLRRLPGRLVVADFDLSLLDPSSSSSPASSGDSTLFLPRPWLIRTCPAGAALPKLKTSGPGEPTWASKEANSKELALSSEPGC